jgi:indole-3-glycerol phosphate synthase
MNILDKIVLRKKEEIAAAKSKISVAQLQDSTAYALPKISLLDYLPKSSGIITEFKRQSPSKGIINATAQPQDVAKTYAQFGASAMSVLTDTDFFGGSRADLLAARQAINIPILRKDFMVDAYQFHEAKAMGADVILLIAACLSPAQVQEFAQLSHEIGLEVLLEIHSEDELKHICPEVDLVGINNRNLKDFKVDLQHAIQLKDALPYEKPAVAESGIYNIADYHILKNAGFDAFLMGEYFMRETNPGLAFEQFIQAIQ